MQKLTVKEIIPPPENWKDKLFKFKAEDGMVYDCWHKSMVPFLVVGKTIEVEVKEEEKNGYKHLTIEKIFENGQPVGQPQKQFGGFHGRTPEENRSIESQVAIKSAIELIIAGKASLPMTAAAEVWILSHLGVETSPVKATEKQPPSLVVKPAEKPQDVKPATKTEVPKATKAQLTQIDVLAKLGFNASAKVKESGWAATKASELTKEQAARLIEIAVNEGFTL